MPLGSVNIGWDETNPADSRLVGLGAMDIRSLETAIRTGLAAEHIWPSSSGSAGGHVQGSAVVFFGASSKVSSADTDGRLMLDSTNSRLHHVGSSNTIPLGGRYMPEAAPTIRLHSSGASSALTSAVTQIWAMETGVATIPIGSTDTNILLQNTYVRFLPTVSPAGNSGSTACLVVSPGGAVSSAFAGTTVNVGNIDRQSGVLATSASVIEFTYIVLGYKSL